MFHIKASARCGANNIMTQNSIEDHAGLGSSCLGKQYLSETLQIFYWKIRKSKMFGVCFQHITLRSVRFLAFMLLISPFLGISLAPQTAPVLSKCEEQERMKAEAQYPKLSKKFQSLNT